MAAIGFVKPQQVDGLGSLAELVALVKDPDAITKAHEEARKQIRLTDEEQAKADEARAAIKEFKELHEHLEDKHAALQTAQDSYEQDVANFKKGAEEKTQYINGLQQEAQAVLKALEKERQDIADKTRELENDRKAMNAEHDEFMRQLTVKVDANNAYRKDLDTMKDALEHQRIELKAKAAKLRETASDF